MSSVTTIKNALLASGQLATLNIVNHRFQSIIKQPNLSPPAAGDAPLEALLDAEVSPQRSFDAAGAMIVPAAIDAHIHSREPGLTHKEDWQTVARGAFRGGVICVADMPNTKPPTMTREAVLEKAACAAKSGVEFRFWLGVGASNIHQLTGLLKDAELPLAGAKIFYGQSTGDLMFADLDALERALPTTGPGREKPLVFHSEDQCLIDHNHEHYEEIFKQRPEARRDFRLHSEIRSSAAALASTRTILKWAKTSGRRVHIAHVSTPGEVELIAEAKAQGARVSGEVAPHHLLFCIDDYARLGPWIKINPPIRSRAEMEALRRLVGQGAVEIFATDHAPHTKSEKAADLDRCPSGAPALEFFYPLLGKVVALTGLSWAKAVAMVTSEPMGLLGYKDLVGIEVGHRASFVRLQMKPFSPLNQEVVSKCGWTPYDGMEMPCQVAGVWKDGRRVG